MKKHISTIVITFIVIVGLGFILYPTVSNYISTLSFNREIKNYYSTVSSMDDDMLEQYFMDADEYNAAIPRYSSFSVDMPDERRNVYLDMLNTSVSSVMGYISIPAINVNLPIYHGTSDAVLQQGVGHLEGSSLPVGGDSTHAVLSAHSGLPTAMLFTDLQKLVIGDTFKLKVLNRTLNYEIDDIQVVLPTEIDSFRIYPGEDYVTLMTCTPYGVNTHRLLVRGHRIADDEQIQDVETQEVLTNDVIHPFVLIGIIGVVFTGIIILVIVLRKKKQREGGN